MEPKELSAFWDELLACRGESALLLDLIAKRASEVVGEASVLALVSADGDVLEPVATYHRDPEVLDFMRDVLASSPTAVGEGLAGTVAADRRPLHVPRIDPHEVAGLIDPKYRAFLDEHPIRSIVIVPLIAYGELVGTLGVVRSASTAPYDSEDVSVLQALADRAALALLDARREPERLSADDYEAIFVHSPDGVVFTVPTGRVLAANPAACQILGLSESAICSLGRDGLLVGDDPSTRAALAKRAATGSVIAEVPMRRSDGSVFIADISSTIFTTSSGGARACVIFRDVSEDVAIRAELERSKTELSYIVDHDELTKLLNRRGFAVAARQALAFADRQSLSVQLLFIDLDQLKEINDQLGHTAGDAAIARLGQALAAVTRANDVAARIGGDEFVVLLAGAVAQDADDVVDRIVTFLRTSGDEPPVDFTVGIAGRDPGEQTSLDELLKQADERLMVGKLRKRVGRVRSEC